MPLSNRRPLHILWQNGVSWQMRFGVQRGVTYTLLLAGVMQQIKLAFLGQRRRYPAPASSPEHRNLEAHIQLARQKSSRPGYLNSTELLNSLQNHCHPEESAYELIIVVEPLHWHSDSAMTVSGVGREGQGAVLALGKYEYLLIPRAGENEKEKEKRLFQFRLSIQMLTMHELGHVFGLYPGTDNPKDSGLKESHCPNACVMHWQEDNDLYEKIIPRPFCKTCLKKLKKFFAP